MAKKILTLMLAAVMCVLCFASCGEKEESTAIKIGGIGPITGGAASYGNSVKNGAALAVKEINAAGGVNGVQLELIFEDDENDAEKAVNAYNSLKDKDMQILMGTVTSTPCKAVKDLAYEDNIFLLTPSGSAVECTQYDNAFRVCFNDPNQGVASAQYIKNNNLATKVAVIYDNSDVYSSGIYAKFDAECEVQGIEIVAAEAFNADNNTDFSVAIQKVKESGAELVFLPIYYEEAALILKQADAAGLKTKFFGCDGLDGVISQLADDAALANGVMLLTPFAADASDEKTQKFTAAYKAEYNNEIPDQFAADGYDGIYIIKAALEKAEVSSADITPSDLCNKLKTAMTQIKVEGVTGTMTWDASGEPTKDPKAMYIQDGAYKAMD